MIDEKKMSEVSTLVAGDKYRASRLCRLKQKNVDGSVSLEILPLIDGVAIEEKREDGAWVLVNTVYWDTINDVPIIDTVDLSLLSILAFRESDKDVANYFARVQEYYNTLNFAVEALQNYYDELYCNEDDSEEASSSDEATEVQVVHYKGFDIPMYLDEDGQQLWFKFNGEEYGCGAFNPSPEDEVKCVIDRYLSNKNKA